MENFSPRLQRLRTTDSLQNRHPVLPKEFFLCRQSSAPSWTIPSSRKAEEAMSLTPGPGEYSLFVSSPDLSHSPLIQPKRNLSYETITSRIDFPDIRVFPATLNVKIGRRIENKEANEFKSPYVVLPSTLKTNRASIGKRFIDKPNSNPGPGAYSPRICHHRPSVTIPPITNRTSKPHPESPGPGFYDVCSVSPKKDHWKSSFRPIRQFQYSDEDYQIVIKE